MTSFSKHRLRLIPACITAVATTVALAAPGTAGATVGVQCSGATITGQGAAVEKIAQQQVWTPEFNISTAKSACSGKQGDKLKPEVKYTSTSSGAGLKSWGAETKAGETISFGLSNAFIGTSEAPSSSQIAEIEKQQTTLTPSTVETLPVGQLAIAIIVNLPENCVATSTAAKGRLVLNDATLQGIFLGTINTWSAIKDGADKLSGAGCNTATPITRVVREDQAGTTHILKRFLGLINPGTFETESKLTGQTWDDISEGGLNTTWPQATFPVVRPAAKGDAEVAAKVSTTPGSIGYVNLAEVRTTELFSGAKGGPGTARFWVEIENSEKVSGSKTTYTYQDPAINKDVQAAKNANCKGVVYHNGSAAEFPPPSVTAPWNEVTTATAEKVYPLCGFIYALALTSYSAYPGTELTEATTVENYLHFVTETAGGQKLIENHDYLSLPKGEVLEEAQGGSAAIGF